MRLAYRSIFVATIGLFMSICAFAAPSFATTGNYDTYSDHPPTAYEITTLPAQDFDFSAFKMYALPDAPSWKYQTVEHDAPVFRDLSKRTGKSYRRTRQLHVTGAPFVM